MITRRVYVPLLDRLLYRQPFVGDGARRYATDARPAFGDLDERLLDRMALGTARHLLDLGCGPGTFSAAACRRHAALHVIAVEPSRDFARPGVVRAVGEALPFSRASIDVAVCLSSIRHVRDRAATLRELRRVVRERLWIVELDPTASAERIANHAANLVSPVLRHVFGWLVVKTAPPPAQVEALARAAGFTVRATVADPIQPVYIMELVSRASASMR